MQRNNDSDLLRALIARVEDIFADDIFKNQNGTITKLKVFAQDLPAPENEEDADPRLLAVPYAIVRILDGSFKEWNGTRTVTAAIIFCLYDASEKKTGTIKILDLIGKVFQNLARKPIVENFNINLPIEWSAQDTETHPFYFGAMQLDFDCAGEEILLDNLT